MKIVINNTYGGYEVPDAICCRLGCDRYDDSDEVRTNPEFIAYVENTPDTTLAVAIIPNDATDWEILDDGGWERIICVVNGKLCFSRVLGRGL